MFNNIERMKKYQMNTFKLYSSCLLVILVITSGWAQQIQTSNENYIMTISAQEPLPTDTEFDAAPLDEKITNIIYYDGLGRPKQQIAVGASPNLSATTDLAMMDWTLGTGSTPFFNQNGQTSENHRITGTDPTGAQSLLWRCGNDTANDADGGWNTDYFEIDNTVAYRYSVWVKRTGSQDGTTYHGTQDVNTLDGKQDGNPYFWYGDLPQLNTWYLIVGVVHPHNYTGDEIGISGVYDGNGNRVLDGKEFKWRSNVHISRFRSYLFYSTNTSVRQYFWKPMIQKLDGTEHEVTDPNYQEAPPTKGDIITHIEYDRFGRQPKEYLPFTATGSTGSYRDININSHINWYYERSYQDDFLEITDRSEVNAYSERIFEASPLNRVLEQGAPGAAWKADPRSDTDHTIKIDWGTNTTTDKVAHFYVSFEGDDTEKPILRKSTSDYAADQLSVSITKDENWQPGQTHSNDHTTKEYADKLDRIVLKRTYNNNIPHDTYYVYDDFGNLTFVIPPKVDVIDGVSDTELIELCYQYKYDYKNRLIKKKIPGKAWESIIYNVIDQPIMTQDALSKAKKTWVFTKYDVFGRVAYTGKIIDSRDRKTIQADVNAYTGALWVSKSNANTIGGVSMYYTNDGYPKVVNGETLTINYYDDYSFLNTIPAPQLANPSTVYNEPVSVNTKSLSTGSKVKVLNTNQWITTITYYDKKARPIYVATTNGYLNTSDILETKFDFVGKIEETTTRHKKGNNAEIVTIDLFEYDHMGRMLLHTQKINDQDTEQIVANTYDELGQLESKKIGGTVTASGSGTVSSLQEVNYKYNIRGWLKNINNVANLGNDLFAFGIAYNSGTNPLYNGNIAKTSWLTANDNVYRSYEYTYDPLNRITSATSNDNRYNLNGVTYDKMGNILGLQRKGHINGDATLFGDMDILSYEYDAGNKLLSVADTGNIDYGFKDRNTTGNDFDYDANGNMIIDRNKGISGITYNHLNLPKTVAISNSKGTGNITYIYDATGAKQKKIVTEGGSLTETAYAGGFVYENSALKQISHPEGYLEPNGSGGYQYVYQLKDIWRNTRITYADDNNDGTITTSEIRREQNYYPFGLEHKGYNEASYGVKNNLKTYQDQEFTEDLGLNTHEWRYRISDPTIGRFWQIDPLAEDYNYNSTYAFQENKLGMGIELEGLELVEWAMDNIWHGAMGQPRGGNMSHRLDNTPTSTGPTKNKTGSYFGDVAYNLLGGETISRAIDGDHRAQGQLIMGGLVSLMPGGRSTGGNTTKNLFRSGSKSSNLLKYSVGADDVGTAKLSQKGILELDFQVPKNMRGQGVGTEMFNDAVNSFGDDITGVEGLWTYDADGNMSDNLKSFLNNVDWMGGSMTAEDAARNTITGKWAQQNGFNNVQVITNEVDEVNVIFTRE